ncbi:cytochrome P450 306a1 [Teleopsis dalmanni]|uniref:cytochrome P450 306a1 n=1 Tax=Teleopsis dalmanni TaxID=139649 RepID=UPI0018CD85FD|nr:cytochrome P450 306a1 [Teleopsis dalmanni]
MGGYGLICAEGLLWKDQRRRTIEWLRELGMTKKACMSRANLELRISKAVTECLEWFHEDASLAAEFNPLYAIQHTLGNIINDLVFGITYARDDVTWLYLQQLQEEGLKLVGVSGIVNFLPFLRYLPKQSRTISFLLEGKKRTHQIYDLIIEACLERLQEKREQQQEASKLATETEQTKKTCILECFLEERERRQQGKDHKYSTNNGEDFYCQQQLRHLLADMFGAGVDTTLTTLRWFLLYMAKNMDCQIQLRKELSLLPKDSITLSDLERIDYLRACISEVQRIRSVVPLGIPHGAVRDTDVHGLRIPKNCMIIPLQWAIHMDPDVWPEPESFKPNRFLDEFGVYDQPADFIPFQTGKRMCLGDDLARMMLLLYVGMIFRKYTIKLAPDYEDISMDGECGITLAPHRYNIEVIENDM